MRVVDKSRPLGKTGWPSLCLEHMSLYSAGKGTHVITCNAKESLIIARLGVGLAVLSASLAESAFQGMFGGADKKLDRRCRSRLGFACMGKSRPSCSSPASATGRAVPGSPATYRKDQKHVRRWTHRGILQWHVARLLETCKRVADFDRKPSSRDEPRRFRPLLAENAFQGTLLACKLSR